MRFEVQPSERSLLKRCSSSWTRQSISFVRVIIGKNILYKNLFITTAL